MGPFIDGPTVVHQGDRSLLNVLTQAKSKYLGMVQA
jgi:hypothetical protein